MANVSGDVNEAGWMVVVMKRQSETWRHG